jgi:Rod binding domain-containing protein
MRVDAAAAGPSPATSPRNALQAARDFEALLVGQLLKAARAGDGEGWLGSGSDASAAPALEFAEEQLASALCARGGLGLATMLAKSLPASDPAALSSPKPELQTPTVTQP